MVGSGCLGPLDTFFTTCVLQGEANYWNEYDRLLSLFSTTNDAYEKDHYIQLRRSVRHTAWGLLPSSGSKCRSRQTMMYVRHYASPVFPLIITQNMMCFRRYVTTSKDKFPFTFRREVLHLTKDNLDHQVNRRGFSYRVIVHYRMQVLLYCSLGQDKGFKKRFIGGGRSIKRMILYCDMYTTAKLA